MGTDRQSRRGGPIPLSALLDQAEQRLRPPPGTNTADGLLFSGNRHESVPRALFLDRRLTPLERNAWQVFRLRLNDDGITALPTYDELRPYLTSMPCALKASHETVARALTLLRLTRWLSLVRRRRDPRTGRIQGNLYVLHDEPLSPWEAMQLDADYMGLVSQALAHASKAVQLVGVHTLKEIADDPLLSGRMLPSRLQVLVQRLVDQGWSQLDSYPQDDANRDTEEGQDDLLRNVGTPSSESEVGIKAASDDLLRNRKQDRTVRNERISKVRTVPRTREQLRLPQRFLALRDEQQSGALVALQRVDGTLQQAVLDEWAARCQAGGIRNPAGYLFGVIQKAIKGEFHAWASHGDKAAPSPSVVSPTPAPSSQPADPAIVKEQLAKLHALFRMT
ncbi:MAG: STY4528 family pathogenicity island replication protein [Gammaproteobacteria bacterium]